VETITYGYIWLKAKVRKRGLGLWSRLYVSPCLWLTSLLQLQYAACGTMQVHMPLSLYLKQNW